METLELIAQKYSDYAWGLPLLILLIGGGIYLLILSRFLPFRFIGHAVNVLRGKYDNPDDPGEISHFQALSTALASTIGMGNIAGVAVAINIGGPGAMFWMWISAIIGMSTKFFTCTLAVMYRGKDSVGNIQGGPMYFIMEGLGKSWKPLAVFFSVCALIGALPVFNVNQLKQAINDILLVPNGIEVSFMSNLCIGLVLVAITAVVILGGLNRISKTAEKLVPSMVIIYFVAVVFILFAYRSEVPKYLMLMITDAFDANYFKKEEFLGGVLGGLILLGIRRGAFSNEAGIGTAPMAHGASKTSEPVREGLVAMLGPFIDTILVCTFTAIVIILSGAYLEDSSGIVMTLSAFERTLFGWGDILLMVIVTAFALSTLFTYSYYGVKSLSFLTNAKIGKLYNWYFVIMIVFAAVASLELVKNLIDLSYALMVIPNMIAVLLLAPKVNVELKKYIIKLKDGRS